MSNEAEQLTLDGAPAGKVRHLTWRQRELLGWVRAWEPVSAREVPTHSDGLGALRRLAVLDLVTQDDDGSWRHRDHS